MQAVLLLSYYNLPDKSKVFNRAQGVERREKGVEELNVFVW
jgi:hypothetical protein